MKLVSINPLAYNFPGRGHGPASNPAKLSSHEPTKGSTVSAKAGKSVPHAAKNRANREAKLLGLTSTDAN